MIDMNSLREIIKTRKSKKFDGLVIDTPCASAIIYVFDEMNQANKTKFLQLPLAKMLAIAKQFVR